LTNLAQATVVGQIPRDTQAKLVEQVRDVLRRSPLVRPRTPNGMPMRVQVSAAGDLGWVGDGEYRYDRLDLRGKPWPPMPELWRELADTYAGPHSWDSAIVNWYDADASLGWHRDRSEADTTLPIVTISLGDACSWAVRLDGDQPIHRTRLESGAVTLLAGPTRGALHTVERLIPDPMFSPLRARGRLSITVRVAGPKKESDKSSARSVL